MQRDRWWRKTIVVLLLDLPSPPMLMQILMQFAHAVMRWHMYLMPLLDLHTHQHKPSLAVLSLMFTLCRESDAPLLLTSVTAVPEHSLLPFLPLFPSFYTNSHTQSHVSITWEDITLTCNHFLSTYPNPTGPNANLYPKAQEPVMWPCK